MELNKINYTVIEECLVNAESKEQIQAIFQAVATNTLDSELITMKSDNLPAVLKTLPKQLSVTNEQALVLIISLHNLMKEYISTSMLDENVLASKFPGTFKKQLKSLLFKLMREYAPQTKKYLQDEFSGLPKMRDFDWRLDIKIASKQQERLKQPVLYVKMDLENQGDEDQQQQVLFQVSKGQLKEILNNFETINAQLSALTSQK